MSHVMSQDKELSDNKIKNDNLNISQDLPNKTSKKISNIRRKLLNNHIVEPLNVL